MSIAREKYSLTFSRPYVRAVPALPAAFEEYWNGWNWNVGVASVLNAPGRIGVKAWLMYVAVAGVASCVAGREIRGTKPVTVEASPSRITQPRARVSGVPRVSSFAVTSIACAGPIGRSGVASVLVRSPPTL